MLKKILNNKLSKIIILSGLMFSAQIINSATSEKKLSLISIIDPVSAASSLANEIISSANIYEQRQIYRAGKKKSLKICLLKNK